MHIAMRCDWISIDWLKAAWEEITGAWNVDIRYIPQIAKIASYVAKYLGKDVHHFEGCKRWWRTHDYETEEKDDSIKVKYGQYWHTVEEPWDQFVQRLHNDADFIKVVSEKVGWIEWEAWGLP